MPTPTEAALGAATLATLGFAAAALARPDQLLRTPAAEGVRYYAAMYAARALPLGVLVLADLRRGGGPPALWAAAAAAQAGDAAIGVWARQPVQVLGGASLAVAYAARARRLWAARHD